MVSQLSTGTPCLPLSSPRLPQVHVTLSGVFLPSGRAPLSRYFGDKLVKPVQDACSFRERVGMTTGSRFAVVIDRILVAHHIRERAKAISKLGL